MVHTLSESGINGLGDHFVDLIGKHNINLVLAMLRGVSVRW